MASAQGLGCMGMTAFYVDDPSAHEDSAMKAFEKAQELGITFLDTAWVYQSPTGATNEELVGKAIKKYGRDKWVIATKFGMVIKDGKMAPDASRDAIRKQLDESLARLGTHYVDLYYQHRQDPSTPIEDVMRTLKELVTEGKIRYVGLSEVTGEELRRAHAVHPVTAIQMEYSLQSRLIEEHVLPVARELGVAVVAYSPLGRGLLSNTFPSKSDMATGDWRKHAPRFADDAFERNAAAGRKLAELAAKKGATAAQLALAWVHAQGPDIFPIPGTKSPERLAENAAAVELASRLSPEDLAEISAAVPEPVGGRYAGNMGTWEARERSLAGAVSSL